MTLAEKLNAQQVTPDFSLAIRGESVSLEACGVEELGAYEPYPLEDARIYVLSPTGEEALWTGQGWVAKD